MAQSVFTKLTGKILKLTGVAAFCFTAFSHVAPIKAASQPQCTAPPYEVIVRPYAPAFGVPTVWDAVYGREGKMVQMTTGLPLADKTVLAAGRVLDKESFKPEQIVLAEVNRRGRTLREEFYPAKDAEFPVKLRALKDKNGNDRGYLLASNMTAGRKKEERQVRLSWYDKDLKFRKDVTIKDNRFNYEVTDVVPAVEGNGIVALLHAVNRSDPQDHNSVIMRYTDDGKRLWQRAYRPGIPNRLNSLLAFGGKSYMATGAIKTEDGRMAGWAMKLGTDGTIFWQRIYPRGAESELEAAAMSPFDYAGGHGFALLGKIKPLDKGPEATWLMAIDPTGEAVWQRYFRSDDFKYIPKNIQAEPDGRLEMMMNAVAVPGAHDPSHIRLLTLSPRGAIIQDEAYLLGREAAAFDFENGWNGERIVTGTIMQDVAPPAPDKGSFVANDMYEALGGDLPTDKKAEAAKEHAGQTSTAAKDAENDDKGLPLKPVMRGWVFVATALDPYEDPCRQ